MKSNAIGLFSLLSLLAITACTSEGPGGAGAGGDDGAGGTGGTGDNSEPADLSCTMTSHSTCAQYSNLPPNVFDALEKQCASQKGTVGTTCSTDDRIGCCTLPQGGVSALVCHYSGGFPLDALEMQCAAAGGSWSSAGM